MKYYYNILKKLIINITILNVLFFINAPAQSKENKNTLYAAVAKVNITPEEPVKMSGYGGRADQLSTGIRDSLYARAVVLKSNEKKLVLISTDVISPPTFFRKAILKESGLKSSELFLSAIHTHSGPTLVVDEEKGHPNNVKYTKSLKPKLITVIRKAFGNMESVQIGAGVGYSPIGINRRALHIDGSGHPTWSKSLVKLGRNPTGITDKEVLVMRIANSQGAAIGILFDYATHGTCLKDVNLRLSGDVLGVAEQFVERIIGNDVIAPVFAGASGDINPYLRGLTHFGTESGWIPEHVLQGTMLGEEVVRVYLDIKESLPADVIKTDFVTIELPGKEEKTLINEGTSNLTTPLNITAACIGEIGFIGFGCEVANEIGKTIKAASPFKYTFVITHCNGSSGYLSPEHLYREGGYEVENSHFAPGAAEIAIKKALGMLYSL